MTSTRLELPTFLFASRDTAHEELYLSWDELRDVARWVLQEWLWLATKTTPYSDDYLCLMQVGDDKPDLVYHMSLQTHVASAATLQIIFKKSPI